MLHPSDFSNAHGRHWEDAELLFDSDRWANADQLYGFSAECGLKAVMMSFEMPVDSAGTPTEPKNKSHVQHLWPIFQAFLEGRRANRYLRLLPKGEPFVNWSHHDRYANREHFSEENVTPHREAARGIRGMVRRLIQDGILQ